MMTQEEFDIYIKTSRTIKEDEYNSNKELFDQAVNQGRIRIKKGSTQITDGKKIYPPFHTYRIELLY